MKLAILSGILLVCSFFGLLGAYRFFPIDYVPEINQYSREYSLDPFLLAAMIKLESNFNPYAVSHANSYGLMQLLPSTANWLMEKVPVSNSWRNPSANLKLGSFYFRYLLDQFDGNLEHALTAYNQGQGNVSRWLEEGETVQSKYADRILLYRFFYRLLYPHLLRVP
ncbi:MAG TPA: lytic transglycosylase domain-containing protein [Thermotogota bacterium]|nr:lytic transglycosylase domain-containing protein [Thermotogota bacterium]HRW91330.1 lytic transglycosylase domain-containing protein [Thermotogota bacterium]